MKKKSHVKRSKRQLSPKKGKANRHTTRRWTTPNQLSWAGKKRKGG